MSAQITDVGRIGGSQPTSVKRADMCTGRPGLTHPPTTPSVHPRGDACAARV